MESVTFDRSLFEVRPVIQVRALSDFHLELLFSTGEARIFDARPYLDTGVFRRLRDSELFQQAYVALNTVCWPGNLDIAPETLYRGSVPI
ncbi:MAG: DUF2442 domain-containing protein [Gallionella sp.]